MMEIETEDGTEIETSETEGALQNLDASEHDQDLHFRQGEMIAMTGFLGMIGDDDHARRCLKVVMVGEEIIPGTDRRRLETLPARLAALHRQSVRTELH